MDRVDAWLSQTDELESDPAQDDIPAQDDWPQVWPLKRKLSNMSEASDDRLHRGRRVHSFQLSPDTLNFDFSGWGCCNGGLGFRDNLDRWVPPSIRQVNFFAHSEGVVRIDGSFSVVLCDKGKGTRQLDAHGVLKLVRRANEIQARTTEENNWLVHSISLLQLLVGETGETYPLQVDSVTATDLHREFCPRVKWQPSRSRSSSLRKRQRRAPGAATPLQTPLVDEVLTARANIAITLQNCDETESFRNSPHTGFGRPTLPLPFKNADQLPIITFEVKSLDGSSLEAENQATICANSILQSWRCLGTPSLYSKSGQKSDVAYPTMIRNREFEAQANPPATAHVDIAAEVSTDSPLHATEETEEFGIDHAFGMQSATHEQSKGPTTYYGF
ncbi:hypothetical protein TWF481_000297 [Arthrobotrys musiformis]|uniref:Uncharacterized protein n=1 Tax=Arthrobotrys musiformis TaxID=47236 RepID=A0AAV9WM66_9PEZI